MLRVGDRVADAAGNTGIVHATFNSSQGWFACVKAKVGGEITGVAQHRLRKTGRFDD